VNAAVTPAPVAKAKGAGPAPAMSVPANPAAPVEAKRATTPVPITVVSVIASSRGPNPKPARSSAKKKSPLRLVVEGCQIRNGSVEFLDDDQTPMAAITGINIECTSRRPDEVKGIIEADRFAWSSTVVEKLRVPLAYVNGNLDLTGVTGKYGNGLFHGAASWKVRDREAPFTLALKFDEVDLARLTRDTRQPLGQAFGTLSGAVDLSGSSQSSESIDGKVRLTVRDGRLRDFAYCTMIGEPLGIAQLSDLRLADSSADLRVADGNVFIENLLIDANDFRFRAKGIAGFNGRLKVAARLIANESVVEHVPSSLRDCWTPNGGTQFIDFKVFGKTHKPRTDLAERIHLKSPGAQFDNLAARIFDVAKEGAAETKAKGKSRNPDQNDEELKSEGATQPASAQTGKSPADS